MILVVGEALVDLVISPSGDVAAALGGAPFNTARAAARLGADVGFAGALSSDRFGEQLAAALRADGVDVSTATRVDVPTTLAAAELDDRGAATYRFYVDGTSAPHGVAAPGLGGSEVVFTGGLGLVLEPMASSVEAAVAAASESLVMVDVNCRPQLVGDRDEYRRRIERVVAHADIVKASDDDLAYLYPDADSADAATRLRGLGAEVVVVTRGGDGVDVATAGGCRTVPVEPVEVVDTVGAGDTFDGALLAWLGANGALHRSALSADLVARAVAAANVAAGIACTRVGADPPARSDLDDAWWS